MSSALASGMSSTGELVEQIDLGRCGGLVTAMSDTHLLARTLHGSPAAVEACDWTTGTVGVELVDRRSGARRLLTDDSGGMVWGAAMSGDGTVVAFDDIGGGGDLVVIDVTSGTELLRLAPPSGEAGWGVRALDDDGSRLLVGDEPIEVWDVSAGKAHRRVRRSRRRQPVRHVLTDREHRAVHRHRQCRAGVEGRQRPAGVGLPGGRQRPGVGDPRRARPRQRQRRHHHRDHRPATGAARSASSTPVPGRCRPTASASPTAWPCSTSPVTATAAPRRTWSTHRRPGC